MRSTLKARELYDISKCTTFNWDTLNIIGPYTNESYVKDMFKGAEGKYTDQIYRFGDDYFLLLFEYQGKIVNCTLLGRSIADFVDVPNGKFGRKNAIFGTRTKRYGGSHIYLYHSSDTTE